MKVEFGGRRSALFLVVLLFGSVLGAPVVGAAGSYGINTDADQHSPVYGFSTAETISAHDLGEMDSPLELYDDGGEVTELNASYNDSQAAPFGVRWDKVEADAYTEFPRVSSESENGATWSAPAAWSNTTSDSTNVSPSVTDADADSVPKVEFSTGGMGAGDTTTFTLDGNVSLDDPNKRVLMSVLNVDTLANGATVEIRAVDSDGDYRFAEVNASENASDETIVANSTGNGYVFQERVGNLPIAGSGDGSLDSIESIEIVVADADATLTVAALDADRKSTIEFGMIERDTDGDGEAETVRFEDYWEGGESRLTEYNFGDAFDTATIHDWTVYEVRYPLSQLPSDEVETEFHNSSESSYPAELSKTGDVQIPSYIDLTHGTLSLRVDQNMITEKYGVLRTAQVDDSTAFGNVSDSEYTDRSASLTQKGETVVLMSGISADQQYRVDFLAYLTDDDVSDLKDTQAMSIGPTANGGGFFSSTFNVIASLVGSAFGALGLSRLLGGGS